MTFQSPWDLVQWMFFHGLAIHMCLHFAILVTAPRLWDYFSGPSK